MENTRFVIRLVIPTISLLVLKFKITLDVCKLNTKLCTNSKFLPCPPPHRVDRDPSWIRVSPTHAHTGRHTHSPWEEGKGNGDGNRHPEDFESGHGDTK